MKSGIFHSRSWTSDADMSEYMSGNMLDNAVKIALVDACMLVEDTAAYSRVSIRKVKDGQYEIEAFAENRLTENPRTETVETVPCSLCSCPTYGGMHEHNGCLAVIVEEVMDS